MPFTTLEDRYNQVSKQIYDRFSPSSDQLVVVKPNTSGVLGSKSRIKSDSRLLPIVSTARDLTRITKFLASTNGVLFLGKQLLLQTGNTFAETRLYNPLGVLVNTDPFIGRGTIRHKVSGQSVLSTSKNPSFKDRGVLQQETLDKFSSPTQNSDLKNRLLSRIQNVPAYFSSLGKFSPKRTSYKLTPEFYLRPEDDRFKYQPQTSENTQYINAQLASVQSIDTRGTPNTQHKTEDRNKESLKSNYEKFSSTTILPDNVGYPFKKLENTLKTNGYFDGNNIALDGPFATPPLAADSFKKTLKDPLNRFISSSTIANGVVVAPAIYGKITGDPYKDITAISDNPYTVSAGDKPDIIKFAFTTNITGAQPVHFRAFLSSLKQNVKPEFNEQRYVGRTERFVTYGGARRTATFQFHIAAFSETEIKQAWARVNYLTGLAFPTDFSDSGFMVPPLFKLTIGGIYDEQPCYLDTLDFDFLEDTTTFDIDEGVSQVIAVNMSVILLEKRSRFYDSPFYKIMET